MPGDLGKLVKQGQRYGFDVVVRVGLWRFVACKQRVDIKAMLLDEHGIRLSTGTVSALCDRFLVLLERLHVHRAPQLRDALQDGYPLHIDATSDRGRGGLFVCMDGWRGWVLSAGRIPTEHADHLKPLVDKTVELFGRPNAVVRDMGSGGEAAVEALRQSGVPDLVCHYHFLAAVGTKLMKRPYEQVRGIIRLTKVRADMRRLLRDLRPYEPLGAADDRFGAGRLRQDLKALVLWVLEGDSVKSAPFPFSLPHLEFVRRCRQMHDQADQWVSFPRSQAERRALSHLTSLAAALERDTRLAPAVVELDERLQNFAELRDVMRLSNAGLPKSDVRHRQQKLPALELLWLRQIKAAVDQYTTDLRERIPADESKSKNKSTSAPAVILRYFERYGARLFGHPVRLDAEGQVVAVVARTNNVLEQFFGDGKRLLRRRVGRAHLGRDLELQPAQVALAANLRSPQYVRVLCGSLVHLPTAFAALESRPGVETAVPIRDQRHKKLRQRLKLLLVHAEAGTTPPAEPTGKRPTPVLHRVDPHTDRPELAGLDDKKLEALRDNVFPAVVAKPCRPRDPRLPPPGTRLSRNFRGRGHHTTVTEKGFRYRGRDYGSLTAVATEITGTQGKGFIFFRLKKPWVEGGAEAAKCWRDRDRRLAAKAARAGAT